MLGFDPMLEAPRYDPERARRLLPPDTPAIVLGASGIHQATARNVAADLEAIGVEVRVVALGLQDLERALAGASTDAVVMGAPILIRGDELVGWPLETERSRWSEDLRALRRAVSTTEDRASRGALMAQLEAALLADARIIPLSTLSTEWGVYVASPRLRGAFDPASGRRGRRGGSWAATMSLAPGADAPGGPPRPGG